MALAGGLDAIAAQKAAFTPVSRRMPSPEVDSLARDFDRVGFGSPVG